MTYPKALTPAIADLLRAGVVIPAHPLALDASRMLDIERQRGLTRYYIDAGAGGIAVGVHTTQFAIREHGMYEPTLKLAAETAAEWSDRPFALIAGITGRTDQALREAAIAHTLGYHAVLLNLAKMRGTSEIEILDHCRVIARKMPLFGFALLPECGGFHLSYEFWRRFAEIDNVIGIKMAPFNRYRTIDIVRAVIDAGAESRIVLYTGNDDHIVADLVLPFVLASGQRRVTVRIRGGLLGHWSVWTHTAVQLLKDIRACDEAVNVPTSLLARDAAVTDCNGAIYDAHNDFRGCIPGCLEVLRRQGLVRGVVCLDPSETMSAGQSAAIDRVYASYPHMNDDRFVQANLHRWLSCDGNRIPLVA